MAVPTTAEGRIERRDLLGQAVPVIPGGGGEDTVPLGDFDTGVLCSGVDVVGDDSVETVGAPLPDAIDDGFAQVWASVLLTLLFWMVNAPLRIASAICSPSPLSEKGYLSWNLWTR